MINLLVIAAPLSMGLSTLWMTIVNLIRTGVLFLPIDTAWDFLTQSLLFGLVLIPVLVFYRFPRLAAVLYALTNIFYWNWIYHRTMQINFDEPRPFSERWFVPVSTAIVAGCALLLAYWLLGKYNSRFRVRVI